MSALGELTGARAAGSPSAAAVPAAVAPPPRHPRFPLLDGLRAVAVLCVVLVHAGGTGNAFGAGLGGRLLAHLNVGVTIFFLISGFLLYRPMIAGRTAPLPRPSTREYAKRRALRIYPAYWLALTLLFAVPGASGVVGGNWWPMYALVHTLPVYHGTQCWQDGSHCGLAQTWSLVVEATFYVGLPLYALGLARLTRGLALRGWLVTQLAALAALSTLSVLLDYVVLRPAPTWIDGSAVGYLLWFSLGMAMAVVSVARVAAPQAAGAQGRSGPSLGAALWALALAAYLALSLWLPATPFLFDRDQQLVTHLAFAAIAALLMAPAVFLGAHAGVPARVLGNRVIAWLGLISYGIFLWHYVVTIKLGAPGARAGFGLVLLGTLAIAIPVAAFSYYAVERPLLALKYERLRDVRGRRTRRTAITGDQRRA